MSLYQCKITFFKIYQKSQLYEGEGWREEGISNPKWSQQQELTSSGSPTQMGRAKHLSYLQLLPQEQ